MLDKYNVLREELRRFYGGEADTRADRFRETCEREMEASYREDMTVWEMKNFLSM